MAVTAVLLAAGYATRLYPLTKDRPKALLPLGDQVILDEVVAAVRRVPDVRDCILVTNHRFAEQFQQWQLARQAPVTIIDDGTTTAENRLGAIRDLELARRSTGRQDDLLVLGTDNLFRWSLADFVAAARRHQPAPTVALWEAPSKDAATQFGVAVRDASSRITGFVEKSPQPPSREVALCVYHFPAAMCGKMQQFLDEGGNADAPGYFIEWLVRGGEVYGVLMRGAWYDIGTLETYHTVVKEWQRTKAV
jgi:glucose-1-phosphate thymidylyltransferase